MFLWTDELLSRRVADRMQAGVEVYGVWDQLGAANRSSQDEMLCAAGARIGIENLPGKVHHKFAVIDVEGDGAGAERTSVFLAGLVYVVPAGCRG